MLAKPNRLKASRDIERVYKRGRYGNGQIIHVRSLENNLEESRAAIVVAKKISKKAVVRNRIRRRIAEQLAALWQTVRPGCDIVVIARADLSQTPIAEVAKELKASLIKAGVI